MFGFYKQYEILQELVSLKIESNYKFGSTHFYIILMEQLKSLQGVCLQDSTLATFDKEVLKKIDLELYPPKRVHYLVNALINNSKVPSEQSMIRSELRNVAKSGADEADKVIGRAPRVQVSSFRAPRFQVGARRSFRVPKRFAPKRDQNNIGVPSSTRPGFYHNRRGRAISNSNRMEQEKVVEPVLSAEQLQKKTQMQAERAKRLPAEIVYKQKNPLPKKGLSTAFKAHSPQWNVLKAYKTQTAQFVEKYRESVKKETEPIVSQSLKDPVPLYFQKKKANQKRRRQEKHELIKKNKKALRSIFGNAIFRKGWPVSRKEIRMALGIEEPSSAVEQLGEFMEMAVSQQPQKMEIEESS